MRGYPAKLAANMAGSLAMKMQFRKSCHLSCQNGRKAAIAPTVWKCCHFRR
jgi:hypothetical protein